MNNEMDINDENAQPLIETANDETDESAEGERELEERLLSLIHDAETRYTNEQRNDVPNEEEKVVYHRSTRSEGRTLQWNPDMNQGPAIIEESVEEDTGTDV